MIYLCEIESPLGKLSVAECKERILAIGFGSAEKLLREHPALAELGETKIVAPRRPAKALAAYLTGKELRGRFSVDLSLVTSEFDRAVLKELFKTRVGTTTTYGALAEKVGRPGAARAVGGAMRRNPIPIVVPCHRVLPTTGKVGNYTGGIDKKRWLLAHEGVAAR